MDDATEHTVTEHTSGFDEEVRPTREAQRRGSAILMQVGWCVIVAFSLILNFVSVPARHRQLVQPATDAEALMGRRTAEELRALADAGISADTYFWIMEGMASAWVLVCLAFSAVIFWKRRDRAIAFVASTYLVVCSTAASINSPALAAEHPAAQPLVDAHYGLGFSLVALLVLLLPNGRFHPKFARWVALAFVTYQGARVFLPAAPGASQLWQPYLGFVPELAVFTFAVGVQAYRYRTYYTPIERQQTKWMVAAFAIHVTVWAALVVPNLVLAHYLAQPLMNVAMEVGLYVTYMATFLAVPVALGFAVFRHRLWDIDIIINRSLIYGLLTLSVLGAFVLTFLGLHWLFTLALGKSVAPVVLAVSTAVAGALFQPTRRRLQRFVDRRIYGIGLDIHRKRGRPKTPDPRDDSAIRARLLRHYDDVRMVGRGGMAEVYRGIDPRIDAPVAIKLLRGMDEPVTGGTTQRFEREANIVRTLRHPNIVPIYDFGQSNEGLKYIVMEYIEGPDLRQHLQREGYLNLADAGPILQDVADALDHAHVQGIVHRDVKPSNVLLETQSTTRGRPRVKRALLTDFGIAKPAEGPRFTGSIVLGTVGYMAPEQIEDSSEVDARADVYSFGILTYQLLTGRRPFNQRSPTAVLIAQLHQPPQNPRELVPEIPGHVAEAILRALSKNPRDRYASAGEMVADMISEEPTEIFH